MIQRKQNTFVSNLRFSHQADPRADVPGSRGHIKIKFETLLNPFLHGGTHPISPDTCTDWGNVTKIAITNKLPTSMSLADVCNEVVMAVIKLLVTPHFCIFINLSTITRHRTISATRDEDISSSLSSSFIAKDDYALVTRVIWHLPQY